MANIDRFDIEAINQHTTVVQIHIHLFIYISDTSPKARKVLGWVVFSLLSRTLIRRALAFPSVLYTTWLWGVVGL